MPQHHNRNRWRLTLDQIILAILLLFGSVMTLWFVFRGQDSFTVLTAEHTDNAHITVKSFDTGVTLQGTFKARWNYMGALAFGTNNADTYVSNRVQFSLKEQGNDTWYYTQEHAISGPNFRPAFPFGFNPIVDSAGKTYEFQITIYDTEAFALRNKDDMYFTILVSKYQYPQKLLLADTTKLIEFGWNKVINIIMNANFIGFLLISYLPALFYLMWKVIKSSTFMISLIFDGIILYEILWMNRVYDLFYVVTILMWIFFCFLYKRTERISFIYSIIMLTILPLPLIHGQLIMAEKVSTWAYLFLFSGVLLHLLSFMLKKKKKLDIERLKL